MEIIRSNITFLITTFTLISNILFVLGACAIVFDKKLREFVFSFVERHVLPLLFVFSASALFASLFYSNIAGFPPCELCWIQRIFMYPQVIISFLAVYWKDKNIVGYLLSLSILGTIVAFYHSLTQWGIGGGLIGCTAVGGECSKVYVLEYGYITIPFMALSSFVYLLSISIVYYLARKSRSLV